ncbi:CaiB/BaiF CoA transferase family protein [Nocardioides daeguensis]|uniref:CaiB/BaiF CoA-transferase family protein n=1 Tax=Nocardioides daeguensis TaxID=908359 RepID=A0ABP6UY92_9ACTN|nr:CaiB/BaiF CoA-transferase family protein [Nocardioides daeguensis]MBV6728759.1 CoA transferase [Nocardioides daeguensis]MCR1773631.1 CoA transferase [Nocardioides daeguensis]
MSTDVTTNPPAALDGIRVVEMGQLLAGPFCGQLLGDFGAEVIKIEPPEVGDPLRQWGRGKSDGRSLWWPIVGRNKMSVTLDLRTAEGQEVARRLIASADVLLENFRPGTLERWGLDPATLWELNPGLVIVRVTGFGQDGPYSSQAGYGSIGEAMGGLRYITGDPDRPPSRTGLSIGDSLAGTYAALGALAALRAREHTGRGQIVDSAIYEAVLAMTESLVSEWDAVKYQRERTGAVLPNVAPSNVYPTSDGAEILIAANQDTVFGRLAALMGRPELADDPRYRDHNARGHHQEELDGIVADWTATCASGPLLADLNAAGVPAGRIYRAEDMFDDPHFLAREAIVRVPHDELGDLAMQNVAPKLSETPGRVRWAGTALGSHTDAVLGDLGLGTEEIADLRRRGVV